MKNILFRNPVLNKLSKFSIPEFFEIEELPNAHFNIDLDSIIHSTIIRLNQNQINSITIPLSITENFLELSGLRLGHHIRLTKELNYRYAPLIFYGSLEQNVVMKLSPLASILSTPNVYYVDISKFSFQKIVESIKNIQLHNDFDFDQYLEFVRIDPPPNYQSRHSIANEWALVRYVSMFEVDSENEKFQHLSQTVNKLDYLKTLHFKYAESNFERQRFKKDKQLISPKIRNIEGLTIGIIDDEVEKGWGAFYDYLFSKSNASSKIFDFYKDEKKEDLIIRFMNWLNENMDLDVFVVDLRLHDEDFSEPEIENLTGIKFIRLIKGNPGKQIVVTTASNKVWNFKKCMEFGVSSFVVKESPETLSTREDTKRSLLSFSEEIEKSSEKKFLSAFYKQSDKIKAEGNLRNNVFTEEYRKLVFDRNGLLDQIFQLLILDSTKDAILNQCLLLSFQILENYCDLNSVAVFGSDYSTGQKLSSGFVWTNNNTRLNVFINEPNQKISTLFELKIGKFDFMEAAANETIIGYNVFAKMTQISSYLSGLDATALVKMISVLHFRESIPQKDIERIIRLRYYRSNIAAHNTGKIKSTIGNITAKDDIMFLMSVFETIFLTNSRLCNSN